MKIKLNKNILWSKVFVEQLARMGVKNACISPGSRNTSLTYALAVNKKIKSSVFVDERSSAFYALGAAKQTGSPVLVVTTSGTAVAELYPAIIEAYKSRIPLIICTADRPAYLRNKGANQTINQKNIFKNHIRFFTEMPLPEISEKSFSQLKELTVNAFITSAHTDKGPSHLNFPFEKPFEPDNYTDIADSALLKKLWSFNKPIVLKKEINSVSLLTKEITAHGKGVILCGSGCYGKYFPNQLAALAKHTGYPVVADGSTGLRFEKELKYFLIENFAAICRADNFLRQYDPEIIIQLGAAPTSASMLEFFIKSKAAKYLVDEFGDWNDPSLTAKNIIKISPENLCEKVLENIKNRKPSYAWLNKIKKLNSMAAIIKTNFINAQPFPFEGRIVNEIISSLPGKCNLIISNSLPVRDFDSFANTSSKKINVYANRGASGIDGLISTSLGIASQSDLPTYLVIGDLSFYHDMNALPVKKNYSTPITIILINNNGGGIFEHLPISKQKGVFEKYFYTPLNLNYKNIAKGYGCGYHLIKNWSALRKKIQNFNKKRIEILEIKTNAVKSLQIREDYRREINKNLTAD